MVYWLALAIPVGFCQERPSKDTNSSPVKVPLASPAGEVVHPVRVSENGRYLVDQRGNAVFWLGTTQWELFRGYTLDDARIILESAKAKGFAFVQVKLLGGGDGTKPNVYGEKPLIDDNPLTPNEAYFKNVDAVVEIARENNVAISLTLFHQRWRQGITIQNARAWARWIATRYKNVPTIVWSTTPKAKPEFVPILRELAAGLHEGDGGRHLITFKPDPGPYSSSFIHGENWLDFGSMQVWDDVQLIYPMVTEDYHLEPAKPVLMAEGAYEAGTEYGFKITPLWIRRQAYYSYLAGGHHAYGHNDSWRVLPTWKQALDAPGAAQLGILKRIFLERKEWWHLVPDQSVFARGGHTSGKRLNLAVRHKDGEWIMAYLGGYKSPVSLITEYLGGKASIAIHMSKIRAGKSVNVFWLNPQTGQSVAVGHFPNTGVRSFVPPGRWGDALLILEASPD